MRVFIEYIQKNKKSSYFISSILFFIITPIVLIFSPIFLEFDQLSEYIIFVKKKIFNFLKTRKSLSILKKIRIFGHNFIYVYLRCIKLYTNR